MTWGYALVWAPPFLTRDTDPWLAKLKFLRDFGLKTTGIGLRELEGMDEARRQAIAEFAAENDLALTLGVRFDAMDPDIDAVRQRVDESLEALRRYVPMFRAPICTTGVGNFHRFQREPTLAWQMDRLKSVLPALAAGCAELDAPLGIENHGDYYCSDLVALCEQVPNLGIFLDTGNTFLIGEQPIPAFEVAAPYVVGTHFKDHVVRPRPDTNPLTFEIGPSALGDGDVPLRDAYRILRERCPRFESLTMQIELIPPSFAGNDPVEALERSLCFVRSLEATA